VAHPIVDARMADGSRVNAVIPPVGGPYLSIRKFNRLRLDLLPGGLHRRDWVTEGGLSAEMAGLLVWLVRARANFLIAGETGAGKTTFVRSLTDFDGSSCFEKGRNQNRLRVEDVQTILAAYRTAMSLPSTVSVQTALTHSPACSRPGSVMTPRPIGFAMTSRTPASGAATP
jgi:hypothetical protein